MTARPFIHGLKPCAAVMHSNDPVILSMYVWIDSSYWLRVGVSYLQPLIRLLQIILFLLF